VLFRKNDYRISFTNFCNHSFSACCFVWCESWSLTLREKRSLRVFENNPKRDEVTGEWIKLHKEALNDLYSSPNSDRIIKSRRIRLAGHVGRMGRREAYTGFWWGNMKEIDLLGDRGVEGRIILRWIFRKMDVGVWTGSSLIRIGTGSWHL